MKKFLYLMVALLFAVGVAQAQDRKAVISADQIEHDFGTIKIANGPVKHTFVVKNTGNAPLVITRVVASCGCTTLNFDKEPIAPGKTAKINVTFDPKGRPLGQTVKTVAVYSNGKDGSFILRLKSVIEE